MNLVNPPLHGKSAWYAPSFAAAPLDTAAYFYRTAAGAEIDLVLELRPGVRWAIECKRSLTPPARGLHEGCKDLQPQQKLLIYPGRDSFPLGKGRRVRSTAGSCDPVAGGLKEALLLKKKLLASQIATPS